MSEVPKPVSDYIAATMPKKCDGKMRIAVSQQNAQGEEVSWPLEKPIAAMKGAALIFNPACRFEIDLVEVKGSNRNDLFLSPPEIAGEPEFKQFSKTASIFGVLDVTESVYRRYLYSITVNPKYKGYMSIALAFNALDAVGGLHITYVRGAPQRNGQLVLGDNQVNPFELQKDHQQFIAETVWPTIEEVRASIPTISFGELTRSFNFREAEKKMKERKAAEAEKAAESTESAA